MRNRRSPLNPQSNKPMSDVIHAKPDATSKIARSPAGHDWHVRKTDNGAWVLELWEKATGLIVKTIILRPGKGGEP
jgi:hypothetical protein